MGIGPHSGTLIPICGPGRGSSTLRPFPDCMFAVRYRHVVPNETALLPRIEPRALAIGCCLRLNQSPSNGRAASTVPLRERKADLFDRSVECGFHPLCRMGSGMFAAKPEGSTPSTGQARLPPGQWPCSRFHGNGRGQAHRRRGWRDWPQTVDFIE